MKAGAESEFDTRDYPYHDFVFPIRLETGESAVFNYGRTDRRAVQYNSGAH